MKAALATWNERIAPVFDVTVELTVVTSEEGQITNRQRVGIERETPLEKVHSLTGLGINTLICGAISYPLHALIVEQGITVVPFITGDIDSVMQAWLEDRLKDDCFAMPGCRGGQRRRRNRRICLTDQEVVMRDGGSGKGGRGGGGGMGRGGGGGMGRGGGGGMGRGGGGGMGRGGGGGMGRGGGGGMGRGGGQGGSGQTTPDEGCVCPQCGHRQPHQRGIPCTEVLCSECGGNMTRS